MPDISPRPGPGLRFPLAALAVVALAAAPASPDTIDQRSDVDDPLYGSYDNIESGFAGGQTFRPALAAVDFVVVAMMSMATAAGDSVTYVVDIHPGEGLASPSIGTSLPTRLRAPDPRVLRFEFATSVDLVPEDTYTFALRRIGGGDDHGLCTGYRTYDRGYLLTVMYGDTQDMDAWFKEGVRSETPARTSSWGRLKAGYR